MTGTRTLRIGALILAVAAVGVVLWGASVVSVAQYAEDLCFDDLDGRAGYGAFKAESDLWPPSYECRLVGNSVEPVIVQHRGVAIARFGATAVLPIAYLIAAALGVAYLRRRHQVAVG